MVGLFSYWTVTMDWHETQESNDPTCFQVSNSSQHSQEVWREPDWAVHHDQVVDECNRKQSSDIGYWSDEMKEDFVNAPHWSIENGYQFWQKVEDGQKKGFHIAWIRTILRSACIFEQSKDIQAVHLSRRKQKRIEVNSESWLESRRSQSQNRQTSCVLHCCDPMISRWLGRNPMRLVSSKNRAIQKILGSAFRIHYFAATWNSLNKEDAILSTKIKRSCFSSTHCLQRSLRKRCAWRPRISFIEGKAWF